MRLPRIRRWGMRWCLALCAVGFPQWHLVTMSMGRERTRLNAAYTSSQAAMDRTHRAAGFASHVAWNESALRRTAWFRQNEAVLELYRRDPWANCAKPRC